MSKKIWFITGISSGLGEAIVKAVIDAGDFAIGTFRDPIQTEEFNNKHKDTAFGITMDVTKINDIKKAFQLIEEKFGRLDVLVNNAGFGFAGAVEETSIEEVRNVFETNFFGSLHVTQAALPLFRAQKSGHIIQISSHSGFKGFPGFGIYGASKFAMEGLSEGLSAEVAPLGIKVTIVEPGPFRTAFAGKGFGVAEKTIPDYASTAGFFSERIRAADGKQEGDPAKAAKAIWDITQIENPPLRLPLGKIAVGTLTSKLESVQKDLNDYRAVAESAVF